MRRRVSNLPSRSMSRTDASHPPNATPPRYDSVPSGSTFPDELNPAFYTDLGGWTRITHKRVGGN